MALKVVDAGGRRWKVRRRWTSPARTLPDVGSDPSEIGLLVVAALVVPRAVAFPFTFLARSLGLTAWVVEASSVGEDPRRWTVKGRATADAKVEEVAAFVETTGRPPREADG